MSLTKVSYSMIQGAQINALDYGAVGDGVTDNTAALVAAVTAAESSGKTLYVPAGRYVTAPMEWPASVSVIGDGFQDFFDYENGLYYGTTFLVTGISGQACLSFKPSTGNTYAKGGSLARFTVLNTANTNILAVIDTSGVLVRSFMDVHAESLFDVTGYGWLVRPEDNSGVISGGHYTAFVNVFSQGRKCANALQIESITAYEGSNSVQFFGGRFVGRLTSLTMDSAISNGVNNVTFHGTTFEAIYDSNMAIQYKPAGVSTVSGFEQNNIYVAKWIRVKWADDTLFSGCRFEIAGLPANYNDGTHGVLVIIGAVAVESAGTVTSSLFSGCGWYSTVLFDEEYTSTGFPSYGGYLRFPGKTSTHCALEKDTTQSITQNTSTEVEFNVTEFSSLAIKSGYGIKVPLAGFYQINALCTLAGEAGKSAELQVKVNGTTVYFGEYGVANPDNNRYTLVANFCQSLNAGDVITVNVQHTGTIAWTLLDFRNRFDVTKIIG